MDHSNDIDLYEELISLKLFFVYNIIHKYRWNCNARNFGDYKNEGKLHYHYYYYY